MKFTGKTLAYGVLPVISIKEAGKMGAWRKGSIIDGNGRMWELYATGTERKYGRGAKYFAVK